MTLSPITGQRWQATVSNDHTLKWPLGGWLERDVVAEDRLPGKAGLSAMHVPVAAVRIYHGPNHLFVVATIDQTGRFGDLLHVSLSHSHRDPFWTEIKAARAVFYPPDVDVMMVLPAEADYVNLHEHAFHLQQCPERWAIQ